MAAGILVALLALAAVALIAWPLLGRRAAAAEPVDDPNAALGDEIDRSLHAIREIDFDHRAGNLSDEDFAELDAAERARAAELLRLRDEQAAAAKRPAKRDKARTAKQADSA
ncbi:MAG TPA: hypothetical protein VKD47_01765 [Miltoncostaeaceae bacterium]|nr:hypothetical protein [Miltoncostaeaceae bacterium]